MPLFILAASLLNATGVTTHLFDLVRMLFGRIRGGVAQVSVLVSLVFSGISGAALADIGALGAVQINQMKAQGYREDFAAGVTMAAATIGPIFPPSIPIIIYASVANVSAVKLLLAGILPAIAHHGAADGADRGHRADAATCRATTSGRPPAHSGASS